jgi:5'-3' exonuclease
MEIDLSVLLSELELSMEQFIDLCIMCGCDYASNIRGIGAVRALALIKQHGSIEAVIQVRQGPIRMMVSVSCAHSSDRLELQPCRRSR